MFPGEVWRRNEICDQHLTSTGQRKILNPRFSPLTARRRATRWFILKLEVGVRSPGTRNPCVDGGKHGSLHALTSVFDSRRTCKAREKQFQTVQQNDICKAFFERVFKKASILAMRDIRTVPLDHSFHFPLNT